MTRSTNARVAGATFLLYIGVALPEMILMGRATAGEGASARLASVAQHASDVRVSLVLTLLSCFCALVLGVTLYGVTREQDHEIAMLGLAFRVGEGLVGASHPFAAQGLLWLATGAGAVTPDAAGAQTLGAFLLRVGGWYTTVGASFFAVGSLLFAWLMLRGRMIPVPLAWLGVVASLLIVVGLPLQLAGVLRGTITQIMWLPMAAFEIPLGFWLLIKGVPETQRRVS